MGTHTTYVEKNEHIQPRYIAIFVTIDLSFRRVSSKHSTFVISAKALLRKYEEKLRFPKFVNINFMLFFQRERKWGKRGLVNEILHHNYKT